MSKLAKKKIDDHKKTKDYILLALKSFKMQKYDVLNECFYQIRTSDLREIMEEMEPKHRYYKITMNVLKNDQLTMCHKEALYNLAVFLGKKENVVPLIENGALDLAFKFLESQDLTIKHHAIWCLFGIASSTPETRQLCIDRDIINIAMDIMITSADKIRDIAGQIIYGIFHMSPLPTEEESEPLFSKSQKVLTIESDSIKYILWSIHFAMESYAQKVIEYKLIPVIVTHLNSKDTSILIPLLIVISNLFKEKGSDELLDCLPNLVIPLDSFDSSVKIQACRTIADFIRDSDTVGRVIETGVLNRIIKAAINEEMRVREQAVYAVIRAFGLGTKEQRRKVSESGGTEVIVKFTTIAQYPFNCNLIDCLSTLLETDFDFFAPALRKLDAVSGLYTLLSSSKPTVSSKAANLIGFIGESYEKKK